MKTTSLIYNAIVCPTDQRKSFKSDGKGLPLIPHAIQFMHMQIINVHVTYD